MDFLDSLDLDISHKKSRRVRSWYLYEQFKSLERNQLDAAQKLKDRSNQDKILRQELTERKARRKLYDQFGLCQSESRIERSIKNDTKSSLSVSTEDLFESFCEVHEGEEVSQQHSSADASSQADSLTSKQYTDDFKSIDEAKEDVSYAESINSVLENVKSNENFVDSEKEVESCNIGESIKLQLETVKENIECLKNINKLNDVMISEDIHLVKELEVKRVDNNIKEYNNTLLAVWTRLVSFAYQCMQLNHGNCYYDYSTQFLTAVLACDVLRRGVGRMCYILQPYVSPTNYATDSDASSDTYKNVKRKNLAQPKKSWNTFEYKSHPNNKGKSTFKTRHTHRKYSSENYWQHCSKYSLQNGINGQKNRRASEPLRSVPKFLLTKAPSEYTASSGSIWPTFSKQDITENTSTETCKCTCHKRVLSPMLKLSQYLDSIINDIDDSKHV